MTDYSESANRAITRYFRISAAFEGFWLAEMNGICCNDLVLSQV